MKTTFVSTRSISDAARLAMMRSQAKLAAAQQEVVTGRPADIGQTLGLETGRVISLRQDRSRLSTMVETNQMVSSRLSASQRALDSLADTAQSIVAQLLAGRDTATGPRTMAEAARGGLRAAIDMINSSYDGAHLFAGVNSDIKPLADYYATPNAANRQAVIDAFNSEFGMLPSDPGARTISADAMSTFLDDRFASLFGDAGWAANWSTASDQPMRARIATHELIDVSLSANDGALRKLVSGLVMVAELGTADLDRSSYRIIADKAIGAIGEAVAGLAANQSTLGIAEERIARANERMALSIDLMTRHIGAIEAVDPYDASIRVTNLLTQLEVSYALTARIQRLSLFNAL